MRRRRGVGLALLLLVVHATWAGAAAACHRGRPAVPDAAAPTAQHHAHHARHHAAPRPAPDAPSAPSPDDRSPHCGLAMACAPMLLAARSVVPSLADGPPVERIAPLAAAWRDGVARTLDPPPPRPG